MVIDSDRYGFNNEDYVWDKKAKYILIGDSFIYGACVNRPYDIGSKLRDLSNENVINLGYPSTSFLTQYATLREYSSNNSENVIWFFYENDLGEFLDELNNPLLIKYISDKDFTQNLKFKQNEIDKYLFDMIDIEIKRFENNKVKESQTINSIIKIFRFISVSKLRNLLIFDYKTLVLDWNENLSKSGKTYQNADLVKELKIDIIEREVVFTKFKKIFNDVKVQLNSNNIKLTIVILPSFNRFIKKDLDNSYIEYKKFLDELNIQYIDIYEHLIMQLNDPLKIFPNKKYGHYNEFGYDQVSKIILKNLN